MHVLVTGGAGFIGGTTTALLCEHGHTVTVLDDLSTSSRPVVPSGATFIEGDVGDRSVLDQIFRRSAVDAVIHFAGFIAAGESMREPARYLEVNTGRSLTLLDAMADHGVSAFVFSSSAGVYGEPHFTPMTETHPTAPTSVYGLSKLLVEQAVQGIVEQGRLRAVALRYFNAAGGTPTHIEHHQPETHLIPLAFAAAAGETGPLKVFGTDYPTPDGTCIRDYIHVVDLAAAHVAALDALASGVMHLICNLGTGHGYSVLEVIAAVERVTGRQVPVEFAPRRPGDPAELVASNDLAAAALSFEPQRSGLDDMIADAWAGYLVEHPNS